MTQAVLGLKTHNPDVLTCIANLSSDEVFTTPEFANQMLDLLAKGWAEAHDGANIWENPTVRFLDPFTKSGVFLRQITTRLTEGLAVEYPDLSERVDHILTKQVFGIGITTLTSLLARRSLYCSKYANGKHSIATSFTNPNGNIWFESTEHTWVKGRCAYCGATEQTLDRGEDLETHAYAFIHAIDIKKRLANIFGAVMQFDVIIGNPPYQLSDGGGGGSARPIYHQFIQQAIKLDPRFVVMVTPSRWFSGGRGLDDFRAEMLADRRLRAIVDFIIDKDAFPKVNVNGGVNYFLWDRDHEGDCTITTVAPGGKAGVPETRALDEFDIFIRRNEAVSILRKVRAKNEPTFAKRVSSLKPFGLRTYYHGVDTKTATKDIKLYGSGKVTWVAKSDLIVNAQWADKWKVMLARATDGNENFPLPIWDQAGPFVSAPGEACSETYLVAALAHDQAEAKHIAAYMRTSFFRFMVSIRKISQDNKADIFSFVPDLPTDKDWTDTELYERYGLTSDEIAYVESQIRDMKFTNA